MVNSSGRAVLPRLPTWGMRRTVSLSPWTPFAACRTKWTNGYPIGGSRACYSAVAVWQERSCGLIQESITNPSSVDATMRLWPPLSGQAECGCETARPIALRPDAVRSGQRQGGLAMPLPGDHEALPDHSRAIRGARRGTGPEIAEISRTAPTRRRRHPARNVDLPVAVRPHGLWLRGRECACAAWVRVIASTKTAELRAAYAAWPFRVSMCANLSHQHGQLRGPCARGDGESDPARPISVHG